MAFPETLVELSSGVNTIGVDLSQDRSDIYFSLEFVCNDVGTREDVTSEGAFLFQGEYGVVKLESFGSEAWPYRALTIRTMF